MPYYEARERNSPREAVDRALGKLSPTKQGDYSDAVSRLRAQHNVAYRNATRTVSRYSPRAEISSDPYASATAASSPFITSFLSSPQGEQPKPSSLSLEAARIARGLPRGTAEQRPSTMRHETQYSVTYSPLWPANQSQIREADMVQKEVFTTKEDTTETAVETKERTASTLKPVHLRTLPPQLNHALLLTPLRQRPPTHRKKLKS